MSPGEEKGEISNEFFKKLNQQIVQKDNLIKLLQLQIKNLKSQVEDGGGDPQKKGEAAKALQEKEAEIQTLGNELATHKARLAEIEKEKDEQIRSLSQMLEENRQKAAGPEAGAVARIEELESTVARLEQELEQEKQNKPVIQVDVGAARGDLQKDVEMLRADLENARNAGAEADSLRERLDALQSELQQRDAQLKVMAEELNQTKGKFQEVQAAAGSAEAAAVAPLQGRVAELEQDVLTLKNLLTEKDEQLKAASAQPAGPDEETLQKLHAASAEVEVLKRQAEGLQAKAGRVEELEKLLAKTSMDSAQLPALKDRLAHLERESGQMAEAGLKLTAAETERQKALAELESKNQHVVFLNEQLEGMRNQLDDLARKMGQKENDVAELRSTIDSLRDKSVDDPAVRVEIEQLTGQVADQLLAIQKLEDLLRRNQELLGAKDQELATLRQHQDSGQSVGRPIPMGSDAEIIANFIDFFDGLDTYLVKNPIPELASLHKKLLERLIIPNEIQYLPVVSEEFNPDNHIATDFFRSDRFPEKCIVFEVEKGYRKGNSIIKKSKVWVVQNLFPCPGCQAVQSNADSRFCHLCGQKIIAPNGLPVDSLPVFEPTPTTYLRFAERAVDRSDFAKAKEYLQEGLRIDPHYVPLLNRLADVCAVNSEFQEALDLLKRSIDLKADPAVQDKLHALEIKNTIFHQAQSLNLPPDEFEKLVSLIQK